MKYNFSVQERKRIRVIIDTDAACEADDPYAVVQALMTPRFIVEGIIAEQFGGQRKIHTVCESRAVVEKVLKLAGMSGVPVHDGEDFPLVDETASSDAPAVDFIIREALAVEKAEGLLDKKLYILCQGAVTNVAAALNKCPEIADRITVIWIGGGVYPEGTWEFNLLNDYVAANVLFKSKAELWQVPMDGYTRMQTSYAELETKVRPCGEIGRWLFEQLIELGTKADWITGESWVLGDNPAIGLAMNPGCGRFVVEDAPYVDEAGRYIGRVKGRKIRIYHEIDSRFILEDLFAKLKLNFGQ